MPVTQPPPHRSRRAALPHRAPALGRRAGTQRCLPDAAARKGQAPPARGPAPGLLRHGPLGPLPSLPLRRRSPGATCVPKASAVLCSGPPPCPRAPRSCPGGSPCGPGAGAPGQRPGLPGAAPRGAVQAEVADPAGAVCASPSRRLRWCRPRVRSASAPRTSRDVGAPYSACPFPCHRCVLPGTDTPA